MPCAPSVPANLIDGVNNTFDDTHMFLAPFTPGQPNYIYVAFEHPVTLGCLRVWNYSKTPERGVDDFELFVDDVLIYKGHLRKAPSLAQVGTRAPAAGMSALTLWR